MKAISNFPMLRRHIAQVDEQCATQNRPELRNDPQAEWREPPVSTPKCMNCGQPAIFKLRAGKWLVCGKCRAKVEAADACPVPQGS